MTHQEINLSHARKQALLALFCLGVFVDVLGICVFYILVGPVASELDIVFEQQTWVITAYGVTLASFLLFWGRVSDLYSPKPVFCYGFVGFGVLNLVISFVSNKYAFLVLRGLAGVAGAALIPSSYRLITAIFERDELAHAFTVYTLSASMAAAIGVLFGGLVEMIPSTGQASGWRFMFRILAIVIMPASIFSLWFIPRPPGDFAAAEGRWKRLDIPGTVAILSAIILFILGLTLGASYGWGKAGFIAPLVISIFLFVGFFFWESKVPTEDALLPSAVWRWPNFTLYIFLCLFCYAFWTCQQIPLIGAWTEVHGDKQIYAALRILPSGAFSMLSSVILIRFPQIHNHARIVYTVTMLGVILSYAFAVASHGRINIDYYRWYIAGLSIGSFCNNAAMTLLFVLAMQTAPAEQAGVVGALLQASVQIGSIIGLTVQAGLETIHPGLLTDFRNIAASFYFMIGWAALNIGVFWVFYRPQKTREGVVVAH